MDLEYNIGQIPVADKKWECGVGYLSIPSDIDRDFFISDCFRKGRVSFKTQDGGVYNECPIDITKFNNLTWPKKWQDNGTPVVYVTEPIQQVPIIIGVLNFSDEVVDQSENQFKMTKIYDDSVVEISGSAEEGYLTFLVNGVQKSNLYVKLLSQSDSANMELDIDGSFNLLTIKEINLSSQTSIIQKVGKDDSFSTVTQNSNELNVRANKFSVNDGSEPITLGNKLKTFLDDFIDELAKTTVTTSLGQMPILNKIQVQNFKNRTKEFLSEISYTD